MTARAEQAEAIVAKLPKTKDGVPIVVGMPAYWIDWVLATKHLAGDDVPTVREIRIRKNESVVRAANAYMDAQTITDEYTGEKRPFEEFWWVPVNRLFSTREAAEAAAKETP
jgi:hypothetical protein